MLHFIASPKLFFVIVIMRNCNY